MNIIETLEKEFATEIENKRLIPDFSAGDTVRVNVKVVEGNRERIQAYEGVCIARSGAGFNKSFTVRKISYGEGVERVFPLYSPWIDSIEVVRRGRVRRAKLYYLRGLRGKAARIAERKDVRGKAGKSEFKGFKKVKGEADNLKLIKGVDEGIEKRLNQLGVTKIDQIANFTDEEISYVEEVLKLKDQIGRDNWTGQAQQIRAELTAGEVPAQDEDAAKQ